MVAEQQVKDYIRMTKIAGPKCPAGISYAQLPPPFDKIPFYRDVGKRWEFMKHHMSFKNQSVIDLGCATGHYCFKIAEEGARSVLGIELDPATIKAAKMINEYIGHERLGFYESDVLKYFTQNTKGKWDVVLLLSTFQWLAQRHGVEPCGLFLEDLSKRAKFMFFETAGSDSMAPLPEANKRAWIDSMLEENGWSIIDCTLMNAETGGQRWMYFCRSKHAHR